MIPEYIHLEHDGKILLVDTEGNGPIIPQMGRISCPLGYEIRLPTPDEAESFGLQWITKRVNRIRLDGIDYSITYGTPEISWPREWAWKDSVISDSAVDPVARESVYRTLHRVVSKVVISNSKGEILMAKVSRGFFTGCWTLPGGFVDYGEHPREAAQREALEELGVAITIPDPNAELGTFVDGDEDNIVQTAIFNEEGINWVSFTYKCNSDLDHQEIIPKDDEIEEARWFTVKDALSVAASMFDIDAIRKLS